ncbi:MAG TPA: SRPBCC family protein [Bacteroidota bacterium]|nr:SRPBCC family protein [Bacteroidota bacterium]
MSGNAVKLHRVFKAIPERVYRAFLEPDAVCKWLPAHDFTGKVHHIDAKVGGSFKMSFANFGTGQSHSYGGTYLELVRNEPIVRTDQFDDPQLPGTMRTTIALRKVLLGTEVDITQEGIPEAIPPDGCYLGWQESLGLLKQFVEADIP